MATSYDCAPDELVRGLDRLRADLAAGARPQDDVPDRRARLGDAVLVTWRRPTSV